VQPYGLSPQDGERKAPAKDRAAGTDA
jgi:hypothetical protein